MGYFYSYSKKVMDPAPRGLGIPVVTLLLEVNEYKYLNADVSWNIFLCLFLVNDDQVILCQGWDGCHLWGERQPCLRPTMCGGRGEQTSFQSKCPCQFSIKVSPASRRVKVFAPPHPGLGQGGRHPCLCTSARKSQLCHRCLEPQAGLPALQYGSVVGKSQM